MNADTPESLRALAEQCRRLARGASTEDVSASLMEIADGYEQAALEAERGSAPEPPPGPTPIPG